MFGYSSNYIYLILVTNLLILFRFKCQIAVAILSAIVWRIVCVRSQETWQFHCSGTVAPSFEKVEQSFRELITSRQERGGAFAVFHKGKLVVDLWGGYADYGAQQLRQNDSLSMVYSATKITDAVCVAILFERGLLDYKAPVSKYWPEFGTKNKDKITVETLLCHRAGLIAIHEKHTLSLLKDNPTKLERLLIQQEPFWTPGGAQGYQAMTGGLYADFLLRKIDCDGRSLSQFFRDEVSKPFDIDFHIGLPKSLHHRTCRECRAEFGWWFFLTTTIPTLIKFFCCCLYSLIRYRTIYLLNFVDNPTDWTAENVNDPDYREIGCGSSHGFTTASGFAKLLGILANGGQWSGRTLLTPESIQRLNTSLSSEFDRVCLCDITYGPGTSIRNIAEGPIFGHLGAGGQAAFCDPYYKVGWAYLTNYRNSLHGFIVDHRCLHVIDALYECLRQMHHNN